jgi:hypothetical protein
MNPWIVQAFGTAWASRLLLSVSGAEMDLATIIDKAKRRGAVMAPSGRAVVEIRLDGTPSHMMSNAVAAFQGELEDIFLRRTEIVAGGSGCLIVDFDLGDIDAGEVQRIAAFVQDERNLAYFRRRYGINAITVRQTPRYS